MKTTSLPSFLLLLITLVISAMAADIKLAWDASPTTGITNYVVYGHTNVLSSSNLVTAPIRVNVGTNLTATVTNIPSGSIWFAATAMRDGIESDLSNIIAVELPRPPERLRIRP